MQKRGRAAQRGRGKKQGLFAFAEFFARLYKRRGQFLGAAGALQTYAAQQFPVAVIIVRFYFAAAQLAREIF